MNIKEIIRDEKKNILYWLSVILLVNAVVSAQNIYNFMHTGLCRNYTVIGSSLHSCSTFEFVKNGWAWLTFTDVFIFLPAAIVMISTAIVLDQVFAKNKE